MGLYLEWFGLLGCGDGKLMEVLIRSISALKMLVGIDISHTALKAGIPRVTRSLNVRSLTSNAESDGRRQAVTCDSLQVSLLKGNSLCEQMKDELAWNNIATITGVSMVEVIEHLDPEPLEYALFKTELPNCLCADVFH